MKSENVDRLTVDQTAHLQTDCHELHAVVGLAVSQLCPEVGQQPLGGPSPDPGHEVVGDVGEGEAVEGQLPAVVQPTQVQRQRLDVRVAVVVVVVVVVYLLGGRR